MTEFTKIDSCYELKFRDSAKDSDDTTSLTIVYPSQTATRLYIDPQTNSAKCLYFTIL